MKSNTPRMEPIKATAKLTGLSEHFVRSLCINHKISAVQAGNKWLVNVDRLIDYLNAPPETVPVQQQAIRSIAE